METSRVDVLPHTPRDLWRALIQTPARLRLGEPPVQVDAGAWPEAGSHGILVLNTPEFKMRPAFKVEESHPLHSLVLTLQGGLLSGWRFAIGLMPGAQPGETVISRRLSGDPEEECSPWKLVRGPGEREGLLAKLQDALDRALLGRALAPVTA